MSDAHQPVPDVTIESFQKLIRKMYFEKDQARGIPATFLWLAEEVGELASALRETDPAEQARVSADEFFKRRENLAEEFADVLAWLATIANVAEVDLSRAVRAKYGSGCPGCQQFICRCPDAEKP
jgi:NTP pyrophosphatase (non-canonical NTP hydrolase)